MDFGNGSPTLFDESESRFENWGHRSTKIIIVSLPSKYTVIHPMAGDLEKIGPQAFYDYITTEEAAKLNIQPGIYLKPEFVMGIYDSKSKTFINNEKYYEKLSLEEQTALFEQVKENYIQEIKSMDMDLEEYVEMIEQIGWESPLSKEEIEEGTKSERRETPVEKAMRVADEVGKAGHEVSIEDNNSSGSLRLTNEFLTSLNQSLLNQKVVLPNGNMIQATHYIEEIVRPLIPENGKFKLKNGIEISARQYIEEFVLGDGQTKYNGDIYALMQDTLAGTDEPPERDGWTQPTHGQERGISEGEAEILSSNPRVNLDSFKKVIATKRDRERVGLSEVKESQDEIALRQERGKLVSLSIRGQLDEDGKRRLDEIDAKLNIRRHQQHSNDIGQKNGQYTRQSR